MFKNAYHEHLRRVPLFANLDRQELDALGQLATELSFPPGEVLLRQGDRAYDMFIVIEGTLEVTRDDVYIADIGPGGFAGEMALLTDSARNATVVAKSDVRLLHIDARSFQNLLQTVPQIAVKMLPIVAGRAAANSHFAAQ
jgi:CRP/FNR family transcriptional regulator, cyclic AMP receptor protein